MLQDTKNRDLDIKEGRLALDRKVAEADLELRSKKLCRRWSCAGQ